MASIMERIDAARPEYLERQALGVRVDDGERWADERAASVVICTPDSEWAAQHPDTLTTSPGVAEWLAGLAGDIWSDAELTAVAVSGHSNTYRVTAREGGSDRSLLTAGQCRRAVACVLAGGATKVRVYSLPGGYRVEW